MKIAFQFNGDIQFLLRGKFKGQVRFCINLDRRASIKDVIESFGLPHTEIGSIHVRDREIDFNQIVEDGNQYTVESVQTPWQVTIPTLLRPDPLSEVSFLADVNVGRLARYLRAAGFDTLYDNRWRDEYIADLLHHEQRILLTRDLRLLMRKHILFGRYVRATDPVDQFREVVNLLGLEEEIVPFSRCLDCNSLLEQVEKTKIVHRLEPLTRKYYSNFCICPQCDKVFWKGSHIGNMQRILYEE